MCDSELHINSQDNSQWEKLLIEDQKTASLWNLSFWSNPAWFETSKHSTLSAVAIKEWVSYHRLSVAIKKETVAQIINSVKEVIPDSKLAKYGDFGYDINYEDMCCIDEDLNPKTHILKAEKFTNARRYDFWSSEVETKATGTSDNDRYSIRKENNSDLKCTARSLTEWLKELYRVLIKVRQIANEAQLLNSWTDTLLKFCLRFVCVLRSNENFAKILNSDTSFIIDYERLRKIQVSKIELKSIPQPENTGDIFLNNRSVDDLWLKISSSQIRSIWKKDKRDPLVKMNFLRSRHSKKPYFSRQTVEVTPNIPKNMETELLGSLLDDINGIIFQSGDFKLDDAAKNYFPEAHGDWTKELFSNRMNTNPTSEKDSVVPKPWNPAPFSQVTGTPVKLERGYSETAVLSSQFYKLVPPPTLTARFRLPYPHMQPQPRNRLLYLPPNNLTSHPHNQQIQHKVPVAPIPNIPTTAYVSQTMLSQNCNAPQQLPIRTHTGQYNRIRILQAPHHLQSTKKPEKCVLKIGESSCLEKVLTENIGKDLNHQLEESVHRNEETQLLNNIPQFPVAPYVHLSHGYNIPFRMQHNVGNATGSINIPSPSVLPNPQLQMHESKMPLRMNYPLTSIRLRTPLIKNISSPVNQYMVPQFTSKPRFLGKLTIKNIKRLEQSLCGARKRSQQYYLKNQCYQDIQNHVSFKDIPSYLNNESSGCEDRVGRWIESVNKYIESGTYVDFEESHEFSRIELSEISRCELSEFSSIKLPDFYNKLGSEKLQNEHTADVSNPRLSSDEIIASSDSLNDRKSCENGSYILKVKKIKIKRKIFQNFESFLEIAEKLKRTKKLRNKINIIKIYFGGINLKSTNKLHFENYVKNIGRKSYFIKSGRQQRKTECSALKQKYCSGTKSYKQISNEEKLDLHQSNLLINDISKYNMLIRENQEFNAFPSKRMKLRKPESFICETEALIRNKQSHWIASLNYFDSIIDELFFTAHGIEEILKDNENKIMNLEINGWIHFKFTVKTVMKNIISSLEKRNLN